MFISLKKHKRMLNHMNKIEDKLLHKIKMKEYEIELLTQELDKVRACTTEGLIEYKVSKYAEKLQAIDYEE